MKKIIFVLIALLTLVASSYAEKVRVYTDYNPVRVMHLINGANADLEASKSGLSGAYKELNKNTLPSTSEDRDCWIYKNGRVQVDESKKSKKIQDNKNKEDYLDSAINKLKSLGITEEELIAIGIKKIKGV